MVNMFTSLRLVLVALAVATSMLMQGCGSFIASVDIQGSRHSLNEAVTVTGEEQLLLALVQTRFIHNPGFVDVSVINTQLQWSAGINSKYQTNPSIVSVGPSLGYSESPTITYTPLQGAEFVRRMMAPVGTEIVGMLMETGWSSEAVIRLLIQRINDIPNGFDGSITALKTVPRYQKFNRVAKLFDGLMARGDIILTMVPNHHFPITSWDWKNPDNFKSGTVVKNTWEATDNPLLLNVRRSARKPGSATERDLRELLDLLAVPLENLKPRNELNPNFDSVLVQNVTRPGFRGDIWIQTRSLQEILYALSWAVRVPPEAEEKGKVEVITWPAGRHFDWDEMYKGLLKIHWSRSKPVDAAITIPYHGNWYYVPQDDVSSKRTFVLLGQLTQMLSGLGSQNAPALTLPIR
jgi:hypothetical protein